jgi:hypothetical protein
MPLCQRCRTQHSAVHAVPALQWDMVIVNTATNASTVVPYTTNNESGYMAMVATGAPINATSNTGREYWVQWRAPNGSRNDIVTPFGVW